MGQACGSTFEEKPQDLKGEPIDVLNQTKIDFINRKTFNANLRESTTPTDFCREILSAALFRLLIDLEANDHQNSETRGQIGRLEKEVEALEGEITVL
jgi:hypothetical protein